MSEWIRYLALRPTALVGKPRPPVSVNPSRSLLHPVLCRPGTRDIATLKDVLVYKYHLPPPLVKDPRVIVDLGCNVGYTLAHFATLYPEARIIGLELESANHELARQNVAWYRDRVELLHAAIWSEDGTVAFGGDAEDAYHVTSAASGLGTPTTGPTVASRSMESLIREFGLDRIDYLKVDIEGAETQLFLRSDPGWLERVAALKVEIHQDNLREIADVLSAAGFRCEQDAVHWSCIVATRVAPGAGAAAAPAGLASN